MAYSLPLRPSSLGKTSRCDATVYRVRPPTHLRRPAHCIHGCCCMLQARNSRGSSCCPFIAASYSGDDRARQAFASPRFGGEEEEEVGVVVIAEGQQGCKEARRRAICASQTNTPQNYGRAYASSTSTVMYPTL